MNERFRERSASLDQTRGGWVEGVDNACDKGVLLAALRREFAPASVCAACTKYTAHNRASCPSIFCSLGRAPSARPVS